ncbi:MAG: hypothetical protein ACOX8E_02285 [Ruminococcus sp.]|jgi:hypothetical protein
MAERNLSKTYESRGKKEKSIWISQAQKCIYFHRVSGCREIEMFDSNEMWAMIRHLIDTGYKVG